MKKLLLLSVACFLFAGNQLSFAQTKTDSQTVSSNTTIQNSPKEKTNQIVNMLARTNKLEADQKEKIYNIFSSMERKMNGIDSVKDPADKAIKKEKMQTYINLKLKQVLSIEQYDIYIKKTSAK
ncbi:MAG: hypothetical protein V7719_03435 [Psychroserpens sp.]|uniref:hypothetical protein n=1 Tax=Psychroserpens sp. TaxID=2020870 RepID=UPI003002E0B6